MHRLASNVEEQILIKAIQEEATWESLPKRLKVFLSSKEDYYRKVKEYCIKRRFKWSDCFARTACKENEYYEDLMRYLRKNLALYPYHLSENVCRIMRITPFRYYCDMVYEVMKSEKAYDSIPNFSAADAMRVTGVGRNEFIDIMNKCRAKKLMWKLNRSIIKEMLPVQPVDFPIESWWTVCVVNLTLEEYRKLSDEELTVVDKVCKEETGLVGELDIDVVRALYRKGLVYLDVPVYPDDHFQVSNLEGFISNREQSYEDPTEELLYTVFVASSEHSTIGELATMLQAEPSQLEAAVSLACRLGWAKKVLDLTSVLQDPNFLGSPTSEGGGIDDIFGAGSPGSQSPSHDIERTVFSNESGKQHSSSIRVALLVDANLTSYLMMGSFSPGLKGHAVTLYEAGKLGDVSVTELCNDLRQVEGTKLEGELQQFLDHALSLRYVLECLRSGGTATDASLELEVNELEDERVTDLKFPGKEVPEDFSVPHQKPDIPESTVGIPVQYNSSKFSETNETGLELSDSVAELELNGETVQQVPVSPTAADNQVQGKHRSKRIRKFKVDILRCESLAGLPSATLQRIFERDYNVVVSMVPLASPPPVVTVEGQGPLHFGPPSRAVMTPWMKLLLYSIGECGPVSIVLIKGQRLRFLPPPLAHCYKALLWTWDGSIVGGAGGKFEGTLVPGGFLLHCLNSLLRHSAILIQPFTKDHLGKDDLVTCDIALPLSSSSFDGTALQSWSHDVVVKSKASISPASNILLDVVEELQLQTTGYVRMLRIPKSWSFQMDRVEEWVPQSVEFGFPLSDTKLTKRICEAAVHSEIFQPQSFLRQREAMCDLKKKLHEFIAEYQAGGPMSRLVYCGEQQSPGGPSLTETPSGKWNPFAEPDLVSPRDSKTPRFDCRRRRSEILSFDGDVLRSFPLIPAYQERNKMNLNLSSTTLLAKPDFLDEADVGEVPLPGINLIFDGKWLSPLDIGTYLQGHLPPALVAEAALKSTTLIS